MPAMLFLLFALLFSLSLAQRPSNSSLCDYYAGKLYGESNDTTQDALIYSIVSLAFGGPGNLSGVSQNLTGILNPGFFNGLGVNLIPWFDGSIDSTNLNNAPVGINWMDGGGIKPLSDYVEGVTSSVLITNNTNQYRLFSHFFPSFSSQFGCSHTIPLPPTGTTGGTQQLSLAYVHKYMDLNFTDLGHFINQLGQTLTHFGFEDQDTQTVTIGLNSQYNVRCAPPVTLDPAVGPELPSLCQDPSCPLAAVPSPDCAAYVNLQPGSYNATTSPTTSPTSTSTSSASHSSSSLSGGAIAGIIIGSIALFLLALGLGFFSLRKRPEPRPPLPMTKLYEDPRSESANSQSIQDWQKNVVSPISPRGPPPPRPPPPQEMPSDSWPISPVSEVWELENPITIHLARD